MTKKIVGFLAIFALSGLFFQGNVGTAEVHAQQTTAQWATTTNNNVPIIDKMWLVDLLDMILKVVYILLWPLLVIAGWAMDNTLVYGSMFHLDLPLWKFWNIMKNFANFTMGFLVLVAILKGFFTKEGMGTLKDGKSPLGLIKKTLIAGVLIQASRFLLAATIDVSTVATYAVWGLPLSVLKTTDLWQKKILAVDANIDLNKIQNLNDKWDIISVTYSAWPHKLAACQLSNNADSRESARYIIWRKQLSWTEMWKCVFGGNMVMLFDETGLNNYFVSQWNGATYQWYIDWTFSMDSSALSSLISGGQIVDVYAWASFKASQSSWAAWFANSPAMMLSDIVTKSKWFVWPMVMIYSSLLNFAEISDSGTDTFGKITGEMIIRTGFALMLFFPLLALAVVLSIRVGFLWLVIAASPFIVLLETFKDTLKLPKDFSLAEDLKLSNIISVIFAPVATVFALSLAVIFITTLINTFTPKTGSDTSISTALSPTIQKLPSDGWSQKYLVWWSEMSLTNFNRWGSLDWFSWIIVNLISLWLMRALVFAAIKSNSIGKKFGQQIETFGSGFMSTLPIIPMPGGTRAGVGSIAKEAGNLFGREGSDGLIVSRRKQRDQTAVQAFIDAKFPQAGAENALTTEKINSILNAKPTTPEEAKAAFTNAGVTDMSAAVNTNWAAIYSAIMANQAITDKEKLGKSIEEAAKIPWRWATMGKADATTKFNDLFKDVAATVVPDSKTIEDILNKDANNKTIIDPLLTGTPAVYECTLNNKIFTVSKDSSGKYVAKPK